MSNIDPDLMAPLQTATRWGDINILSGTYHSGYTFQVASDPSVTYTAEGSFVTGATRSDEGAGGTAATGEQRDALALIKATLGRWGLPASLADWAWQQILGGRSNAEITLELRERPEYKQRFPGMDLRRQAGYNAISEEEYLAYETSAKALFRAYGIPEGFWDEPSDIGKLIGANVSPAELNARVQDGFAAALSAPGEVRDELHRLYGVEVGGLAAFFLDPDRALPVLERQFVSAQIGGAARRTGFGLLALTEAERLADLGVTAQQGEQGFGALQRARELFDPLTGLREDTIGRQQQLGAVFEGDTVAQQRIERQRRRRQATFEGGGGFAQTREGFGGLGVAE